MEGRAEDIALRSKEFGAADGAVVLSSKTEPSPLTGSDGRKAS